MRRLTGRSERVACGRRTAVALTVAVGLVLAGCSSTSPGDSGTEAIEAAADPSQSSPSSPTPSDKSVIKVEDADPATPSAGETSTTSDGIGQSDSGGDSDPPSTTTTIRPASTAPPSTASATTAAPSTAQATSAPGTPTTEAEVSILETRIEILNLALPTYGGGTFSPDSMVGKNVILWFWGAH